MLGINFLRQCTFYKFASSYSIVRLRMQVQVAFRCLQSCAWVSIIIVCIIAVPNITRQDFVDAKCKEAEYFFVNAMQWLGKEWKQ